MPISIWAAQSGCDQIYTKGRKKRRKEGGGREREQERKGGRLVLGGAGEGVGVNMIKLQCIHASNSRRINKMLF